MKIVPVPRPSIPTALRWAAAGLMAATSLLLDGGPAFADTTLRISFSESHDRLGPDGHAGIVRTHEITATLSGNQVSEANSSASPGAGRHGRHARFTMNNSNREALGDESGKVVWHVKGPHQLLRLSVGPNTLIKIEVEIAADNTCKADVKFLLKRGQSDMIARRADNGEMAHFSMPKLLSSECAIQ